MNLTIDIAEMVDNINVTEERVLTAVEMLARTRAPQYTAQMQRNRPWTDITGEAKRRMNVQVSRPEPSVVRMTFAHGVFYGVFLELANQRVWGVVIPTMNRAGPEMMDSMSNIMGR